MAEADLVSFELVVSRVGDDPAAAVDALSRAPAWPPFRAEAAAFVAALSADIMRSPQARQHPEMIAFAYRMRRQALLELQASLQPSGTGGVLRGRGLALHFAPANVDTIFLYSLMLSLLAGNANVVRLSSRTGEQVSLVLDLLAARLDDPAYAALRDRVLIVRYEHSDAVTARLSALADLRVVWGGDNAVAAIRRAPLRPLARDVVFPDRWSMAVLDADSFLAANDPGDIARGFVNDAYWFGQMACSSPRLVVWLGDDRQAEAAADRFYALVHEHAERFRAELQQIDYVNKRVFEDGTAADHAGVRVSAGDGLVSRIDLPFDELGEPESHCGGGAFVNSRVERLEDLAPLLARKLQTVVSFGVPGDAWRRLLSEQPVGGVDRIVAPGAALDFNAVWDGMNLLREFTRETTVAV